jgi:hypothetical protein
MAVSNNRLKLAKSTVSGSGFQGRRVFMPEETLNVISVAKF